MMMQESAGVSSISARDHQLIGQYCKEQQQQQQQVQQQQQQHQQRSNMNPNGEHEQALKCPRCDSPNTKFCYYNNYNLTQPRHFCKTCRRYWTKGGALRNVPIGGGCRKNKRSKQRPKDHNPLAPVDQDSSPTALNVSNSLSLLQNLWPTPAASSGSSLLDLPSSDRFNLAFAKLQTHSRLLVGHHNITDGNINTSGGHGSSSGISIMSLLQQQQHQPSMKGDGIEDPSGGHMINLFQNPASHIASVIVPPSTTVDMGSGSLNIELESLSNSTSCVNGDWPWRLQQHRLGMVLGDQGQNSNNNVESGMVPDHLILPDVNDHRFIHLQHQYMKGKSAVTNDLVTQAFETRPVSEWQSVADSLLELTPTPTPTTAAGESSYWHDLQSM